MNDIPPFPEFSPAILAIHWEELEYLLEQRTACRQTPGQTWPARVDLDERIEAHLDGLLIGEAHLDADIDAKLAAKDPAKVCAAACVLLRRPRPEAAAKTIEAIQEATGPRLEGLCQAFRCSPATPVRKPLQELLTAVISPSAAAAAEILAFHGLGQPTDTRFDEFIRSSDAQVRLLAWRSACWGTIRKPEAYSVGFQDESPEVRREALWAAAWGRFPRLVEHCRVAVAKGAGDHLDAAYFLALLGQPADAERVLTLASRSELGAERFRLLGALGHPAGMPTVLPALAHPDARIATAAGAAFTKLTGRSILSTRRAILGPSDGHEPDAFEREFLEEVTLPDPARAQAHWEKIKASFQKGSRWCWGAEVSQGAPKPLLCQMDLESRWEHGLRGRWLGTWEGVAVDLERFPQRR